MKPVFVITLGDVVGLSILCVSVVALIIYGIVNLIRARKEKP